MFAGRRRCSIFFASATAFLLGVQLALLSIESYRPSSNYSFLERELSTFSRPKTHSKRKSRRGRKKTDRKLVGSFNGFDLYYHNETSVHSSVQCVGENYQEKNAWMHRSCKFRHFCLDISTNEFVIFQSDEEKALQDELQHHDWVDASNVMNETVSIGGINSKWMWSKGVPRLEWSPRVIHGELREYYALDPSVVWVPFHSMAAFNPGHLVWDDFLPIYTLLKLFQLFDDRQMLLMRYILPGEGMWATCDANQEKKDTCHKMFQKFLPLMGLTDDYFSTSADFRLDLNETAPTSKLICAAHGAAGLGMLTDHGLKKHGWEKRDYESMHNQGRGSMLWDFRNFMVSNVGLPVGNLPTKPPYKIVFSVASSTNPNRALLFDNQTNALVQHFGDTIEVKRYVFKRLSAREQVKIASEAAIFITVCGGGAVTATFLPHGAAAILYYAETGGSQGNRATGLPARLDWDLFNNMGYLRTHWLPSNTMDTDDDIDIFVKLVRHELDLISHQDY